MTIICNVFKYITNLTVQRVEQKIIHSIIILIILIITIPSKYRVVVLGAWLIMYYRTLKLLIMMLQIFFYKKHDYQPLQQLVRNEWNSMNFTENFRDLPSTNSIIIANYPSELIEYSAILLIPRKITPIIISVIKPFVKFGIDLLLVNKEQKNNYQHLKKSIKDKIKHGSIFCYINNPSTIIHKGHLGQIRKGIFNIAYELKIPITPMMVDTIDHTFGSIMNQRLQIHIGPTEYIDSPAEYIQKSRKYFQEKSTMFAKTKHLLNSQSGKRS